MTVANLEIALYVGLWVATVCFLRARLAAMGRECQFTVY
jgi:hypothetical protein